MQVLLAVFSLLHYLAVVVVVLAFAHMYYKVNFLLPEILESLHEEIQKLKGEKDGLP